MTKYNSIIQFATEAHGTQKRKYTNEPYINHPLSVAEAVKENGGDGNMIAASILHDVLEDTHITHEMLRVFLHKTDPLNAEDILNLVVELTDVYTKENFPEDNRKARKSMETFRLSTVSERAQTIKIADIEDNTPSIIKYAPKFAKVFLAEKEELLLLISPNGYESYINNQINK